jgi:cbb3-type cytochrome oxidase subunit 3
MDALGVLAEAYAIKGLYKKTDDALRKLEQLANTEVRKNNLRFYQSRVALAKGDYRTAYEKEEAFLMGMQQLNLHGQAESIMAVQRNYYKGLHDAEITRARTRKWKIGGLIALFILIIGLLFSMYNRQRRRRIEDQKTYIREMEEASSLAQNLKRQIDKFHLIGNKWDKILKTIETVISLSCEEYGADAQKSARKLRDDFRSGKYNQDLMALADAISQNAVTNLKKEVRQKKGTLEEEDYLLYALWIDGLTNTAMSHLFKAKGGKDLQVNALYARKYRLKSKLEDILGEEADKFISILQ